MVPKSLLALIGRGSVQPMDPATLYFIITMHSGAFRVGHYEAGSMYECVAYAERTNSDKKLSWCRPSQEQRPIVIAQ